MVAVGAVVLLVIGLLAVIVAGCAYAYVTCVQKEDDGGHENIKEIKAQTNEYKIKYSELTFGSLLGKGNQGEVYRAKFRSTAVAVKKIDCRKVEPDIIEEFVQEVNIWHRLRNQFITKFMGVCLEYPHLCIVTEMVHRGSLFGLLHDEDAALTWPRRLRIASDLARGMNYLHEFDSKDRIIHRDLKSLNVLITNEWRAKVADFGMTRFQDNKNVMTTCGTPLWMAPEIIRRKEYNYKVDVYSYGIVLWELYTRKIPYKSLGIPAKYLVKKVAVEFLRPRIPSHCPQLYSDLMQQCWTTNPKQRPSFSQIVEHCDSMLKDPSVVAHHPVNEVVVAKAGDQVSEHKSIVANFEVGRWLLERKEVEFGDLTKELPDAKVYNGKLRNEDVKITVFPIDGEQMRKALQSELDEVSNLRHPRLLLFMAAYFEGNQSLGVVTERVQRESLNTLLLNLKTVLEWNTMLTILIDTCQAMAYLHGQKYVMRKFNPMQMHLSEHWRIKLDIATALPSTKTKEDYTLWSAPEVLRGKPVDETANIYSLGLIIWQILARKSPYGAKVMDAALIEAVSSGRIKPQAPPNVAPSLARLMSKCLSQDRNERGDFEAVLAELQKIKKIGPPAIVVDARTAKKYCKTATVYAFQTKDACQVEKDWGKQAGKGGCWVICNPQEDDLYLCDEAVFGRNYQKLMDRKNQFRKVGTVWARQMDKPFALKTSDGVQYGVAGDFVVRDAKIQNGDLWLVDKITFNKIYSSVDEVKEGSSLKVETINVESTFGTRKTFDGLLSSVSG
mmetsp:Transcript_27571/g.67051  ORF Transcript_27571/g.67051 Transcript_27571/m.67051 type:complete len:782 (-) Transcript_27571:253-2598(-)|eukprot:CAMPEP_0114524660 /NCGR_PEP_ID=MMETSP0109-20121206/21981_1 /TAXON_ID=29199 /ORGANISM="Chlorarachnion reptans, Strain CCCM449" /LENGTH=781 /DNA_ID=CAMNT_0001706133 /DNA_START=317 /DNA_END=2662 /DNA_ORIENTATION=-